MFTVPWMPSVLDGSALCGSSYKKRGSRNNKWSNPEEEGRKDHKISSTFENADLIETRASFAVENGINYNIYRAEIANECRL